MAIAGYFICGGQVAAQTTISILSEGTWAYGGIRDPFKKGAALVAYLPEGTIVFEEAPNIHKIFTKLTKVRTHYGHWVHIQNSTKRRAIRLTKERNYIIFLDNLLCLSDANTIILPTKKCESGLPRGRGWLATFTQHPEKNDWLDIAADLDAQTLADLKKQEGFDEGELKFDIPKRKIDEMEVNGLIVRLDRDHPVVDFDYADETVVYFQCGTEREVTISSKSAERAATSADVTVGVSFFGWLESKITGSLSASLEKAEQDSMKVTYSTTDESVMYFEATMHRRAGLDPDAQESEAQIIIEKRFECAGGGPTPQEVGKKITSVVFHVTYGDDPEPTPFAFEDPSPYVTQDKTIFGKHRGRPIFFSINDLGLQEQVIKKIMNANSAFDFNMAHFVFANLNNACTYKLRPDCLKLVKVTP